MTDDRLALIQAITDMSQPGLRMHKNVDAVALFKQMILKDLYKDKDLFEVLHNPTLEAKGAAPEDYRGVNLFSFLKIPDTQSTVKNFLCFDINVDGDFFHSDNFLKYYMVFRCVSHEDDVKTEYGIDRQDLLAMIVNNRFAWTNFAGMSFIPEYNMAKIAENGYYYREVRFKISTPNAFNQKGTFITQLDRNREMYGN